jgi:hypothetical protein
MPSLLHCISESHTEPQSDLELSFAEILIIVVYSPCAGGLSLPDSE